MRLRELVPGDKFVIPSEGRVRTYEVYERLWDWAFDESLSRDNSDINRIVKVDCFSPGGVDPHTPDVDDYRFEANIEVEKVS